MEMTIDRVSINDLTYDDFVKIYLDPQKPVVIEDVFSFDQEKLTPEYVKEQFLDENRREAGWFDSPLIDNDIIKIPEIVKKILNRDDMAVRPTPMRLFMQPGGHVTLPHYDGNSLHGLNLQVIGQKKWIIISPNTPLPNIPFMFAAMVDSSFEYDPKKYDFYEFNTKSGDMLFLPRYWYHEVHSLDKVNFNVNWVFTQTTPDESTVLGKREVEIVKIRKSWPLINKAFFPDEFSSYGGQGQPLIDAYSKGVGSVRMFVRLLKEVSGYPTLLVKAKKIKARAAEFYTNNFNV